MSSPLKVITMALIEDSSEEQRLTTEQFPWKLHRLLDDAEAKGYESIVSWFPQGDSFKVHNKAKFASQVMPVYFNSKIYKSFQRSLNLWGFDTVSKGPDKGVCFHPYFRRNQRDLCFTMRRITVKGRGDGAGTASAGSASKDASKRSQSVETTNARHQSRRNLSEASNGRGGEGNASVGSASMAASRSTHSVETPNARDQPSQNFSETIKQLPLPVKLHAILSDSEAKFIKWSADGKTLHVINPDQFESYVAPNYFSYSSLNAFVAELKSYGFNLEKSLASDYVLSFGHDVRLTGFLVDCAVAWLRIFHSTDFCLDSRHANSS